MENGAHGHSVVLHVRGVKTRTFIVNTASAYGGTKCPASPENQDCGTLNCPIDCEGSWSMWSSCSSTCGGGSQMRNFTITMHEKFGGQACPKEMENQNCGTDICPADCILTWSTWGACSVTCGGGSQNRSYTITTPQVGAGSACVKTPLTQSCGTTVCPENCIVSWSAWTACDVMCGGGTQNRSYTVITPQVGTGSACVTTPLTQSCGTTACPEDCIISWSAWTACDVTCGGGTQNRSYTVITPQVGAGSACVKTPLTQSCGITACPEDCIVSWSAWTACDVTCGGGTQNRSYTVIMPQVGAGSPCVETPLTQSCGTTACPEDCIVSWSAWTACDVTCGGGTQNRTYTIASPKVGSGAECVTTPLTQSCGTTACPEDCIVSWSAWTACDVTCGGGTQNRSYTVITPQVGAGSPCVETPLTQSCGITACPEDCIVSWSAWTTCDVTCGGGTQNRSYTVMKPHVGAGSRCVKTPLTQSCETTACPEDCIVSWSAWTACDVTCGGGTQNRSYTVIRPQVGAGSPCVKTPLTQSCGITACPEDCIVSWSAWTACDVTCGGGTQNRSYTVITPQVGAGSPCVETPLTQSCGTTACPEDCIVSWSAWTACDVTCGGGTQNRSYTVITPQVGTGSPCVETPLTQSCETTACPEDCIISWSAWTACDVTCGGGTQNRSYTVITPQVGAGSACVKTPLTQSCGITACPEDCIVSWSAWTACDVTCGGGTQNRSYTVIMPQVGAGSPCVKTPLTQSCGTTACPEDCIVSWSAWTACDVTCGGGTQNRTYTIASPKVGSGAECVTTPLTQSCGPTACPEDCIVSWSAWTACDVTCGGGTQNRSYTVITPQVGAGSPCVETPLTQSCETTACPEDCIVSWSAWTACDVTCGGGTQKQILYSHHASSGNRFCMCHNPIDAILWNNCMSRRLHCFMECLDCM